MKITRITPSKHIKDRFWLELENDERLAVTTAQVADYSLYSGRELSVEELRDLRADAEKSSARARALRILGARNMSRRQITERLVQKGESGETAEDTAAWLESIGAVDDGAYAELIVKHYSGRGFGAAKIKDELFRRGIPRELWDTAMTAMTGQEDAAYAFFAGRMQGAEPERTAVKKVSDAAYRRGFSWEDIRAAAARYETEYEEKTDE